MSIEAFVKFVDMADAWSKDESIDRQFCAMRVTKDYLDEPVYSEHSYGKFTACRALQLFFDEIRTEWSIEHSQVVELVKNTRDCIRATSKNAVAWEAIDTGIALIHFDVVQGEYIN